MKFVLEILSMSSLNFKFLKFLSPNPIYQQRLVGLPSTNVVLSSRPQLATFEQLQLGHE
jgi:hypothetical protein